MELMPNPTITTTLFLFLLLAAPCFSSGETESENIYEIDYRGPETHSHYRPSPGRAGHMPLIHGRTGSSSESKGLRGGHGGVTTIGSQNVREVHG